MTNLRIEGQTQATTESDAMQIVQHQGGGITGMGHLGVGMHLHT
jgi:hypothetical protein